MEEKQENKKRGFLSKMFLVDDTNESTKTVEKKEETNPHSSVETVYVQSTTPTISGQQTQFQNANKGSVSQEIYEKINQLLSDSDIPGPDYLDLKRASDAMKNYIFDENQRLIAAYNTLKATNKGLTKKIIVDSISKYLNVIENEKALFANESKNAYVNEVDGRELQINNLTSEIKKYEEEMEALKAKIMENSQAINNLAFEKNKIKSEIEVKVESFNATSNYIVSEINSDKTKIENLITE